MTPALTRLGSLRNHEILAQAEYQVAREAMLGAVDGVSAGRSSRVAQYRTMEAAGLPRSDWADLRDRLLGLPYAAAPARWGELLSRLESLHTARRAERLSRDAFETVKYGILGRLYWLQLVGKLLWTSSNVDGLEVWRREDGWAVSDDEVQATMYWIYQRTPREASPVRGEHVHEYIDWAWGQCWDQYNDVIADGDARYLQRMRLRRMESGVWTFEG